MSRKKDKFAATIFTKLEEDGKERYYVCSEIVDEIAELGRSIRMGIYKLVRVETLTARIEVSSTTKISRKR